MLTTLKTLCNIPSVSGREKKIREKISSIIKDCCDEVRVDNIGNLIASKYSARTEAKKIMLCAHMDSIGFLVTFIENNGRLRIAPIGNINFAAAAYRELVSERGTVGILVPDAKTKPDDFSAASLYIDIGAKNKKEAEKRISIGDFFVLRSGAARLVGTKVAGSPLDDRIGCAVLLDVAQKLKDTELDCDVHFVFSAQEELGGRGAKTASFALSPDYALVIDTTSASTEADACELGSGVGIKIKDSATICSKEVVDMLAALAADSNIPYRYELTSHGTTDAVTIQMSGSGTKVGVLTVPLRYGHSGTELWDMFDAAAMSKLTVKFIENIK